MFDGLKLSFLIDQNGFATAGGLNVAQKVAMNLPFLKLIYQVDTRWTLRTYKLFKLTISECFGTSMSFFITPKSVVCHWSVWPKTKVEGLKFYKIICFISH